METDYAYPPAPPRQASGCLLVVCSGAAPEDTRPNCKPARAACRVERPRPTNT